MPSLDSVWPLRPPVAVAVAVNSGLILSMGSVLLLQEGNERLPAIPSAGGVARVVLAWRTLTAMGVPAMSTSPLTRYPGKDADVVWDERLCIHIGECGRAFGDLFVGGRKPWCQPDLATVAEVADVVERCPSGALVYEVRDGKTVERPAARNTIAATYNGPLFARGDLAIEGAPADMPGVRFRAALCRCGESKNKPFCDNSHDAAGFKDSGAVGQHGDGLKKTEGGKLEIKPQKNGPLQVKRQPDDHRRQRTRALGGREDVALPLRPVEEQAVLRRQPQGRRLQGRVRTRRWQMKSP